MRRTMLQRLQGRISDQYKRAGVSYTINKWKLAGLFYGGGAVAITAQVAPGVRNQLPEPFDGFDHAANFFETTAVSMAAATAAHYLYSRQAAPRPHIANQVAMGAAFLVGLAANVYGETPLCEPLFNAFDYPPTHDPIDFAYGAAGAAATAAAYASTTDWLDDVKGQSGTADGSVR